MARNTATPETPAPPEAPTRKRRRSHYLQLNRLIPWPWSTPDTEFGASHCGALRVHVVARSAHYLVVTRLRRPNEMLVVPRTYIAAITDVARYANLVPYSECEALYDMAGGEGSYTYLQEVDDER